MHHKVSQIVIESLNICSVYFLEHVIGLSWEKIPYGICKQERHTANTSMARVESFRLDGVLRVIIRWFNSRWKHVFSLSLELSQWDSRNEESQHTFYGEVWKIIPVTPYLEVWILTKVYPVCLKVPFYMAKNQLFITIFPLFWDSL